MKKRNLVVGKKPTLVIGKEQETAYKEQQQELLEKDKKENPYNYFNEEERSNVNILYYYIKYIIQQTFYDLHTFTREGNVDSLPILDYAIKYPEEDGFSMRLARFHHSNQKEDKLLALQFYNELDEEDKQKLHDFYNRRINKYPNKRGHR